MLLTHYVKQRPRERWEGDAGAKLTPTEALLYKLAPDDSLFTKYQLHAYYVKEIGAKPSEYHGYAKQAVALDAAVDRLVKDGYLKEIHGIRLANWLKTF